MRDFSTTDGVRDRPNSQRMNWRQLEAIQAIGHSSHMHMHQKNTHAQVHTHTHASAHTLPLIMSADDRLCSAEVLCWQLLHWQEKALFHTVSHTQPQLAKLTICIIMFIVWIQKHTEATHSLHGSPVMTSVPPPAGGQRHPQV